MEKLRMHGFDTMTGVDNPDDPDLGNTIENGYIYTPFHNADGSRRRSDRTLEMAAVELAGVGDGLLRLKRSFCFEIPGNLVPERKTLMLQIIEEEFLKPLLRGSTFTL
jgi:hypothetical protein